MIITECIYLTNIISDYTFIKVKYNVKFEEILRVVKSNQLLVKPSAFIGLKREQAIQLDTTKVTKIEVKNQLSLF